MEFLNTYGIWILIGLGLWWFMRRFHGLGRGPGGGGHGSGGISGHGHSQGQGEDRQTGCH